MPNGEPTLDEMLAEPIVQHLIAADGLKPEDVLAAVIRARCALGSDPDLYPEERSGVLGLEDEAFARQKPLGVNFPLAPQGPFSNRASIVNVVLAATRIMVLFAVGIIRRNIWSEAQAMQCPQRAGAL